MGRPEHIGLKADGQAYPAIRAALEVCLPGPARCPDESRDASGAVLDASVVLRLLKRNRGALRARQEVMWRENEGGR